MSEASFAPRSMKRRNVKGLALAAPKPPPLSGNSGNGPGWGAGGSRADDGGNEAQLEIGIEFNLDIRPEDIEIVKELGSGNGGTVSKVRHLPTGTTMARKVRAYPLIVFHLKEPRLIPFQVIHVEANKELRKRIVRELQIMHGCQTDYIVTFYGAFLNDHNDVIMCMEYMDVGCVRMCQLCSTK
jgi:mitogen-activated protein kinase kinase